MNGRRQVEPVMDQAMQAKLARIGGLSYVDHRGNRVPAPLPDCQGYDALPKLIAAGYRVQDCFIAMKAINERVHAAMRAIHGPDWQPLGRG